MRILSGAVFSALAALLSSGLLAQSPPTIQKLTFEVASIKPHSQIDGSGGWSYEGGRQTIVNTTALILITSTFGLHDYETSSVPSWVSSDRFDVVTISRGNPTSDELDAMMLSLLEERFALKAHVETRELPMYRLVLARADRRLGGQLVKAPNCETPDRASPCAMRAGGGNLLMSGKSIRYFANYLESLVQRRIDDQTGLSGDFDLTLAWSRGANDTERPEIFTALQEQLGLKLEPTRGPGKMLVIDHIEHPTAD
jgi:uncharacterized protein (TIGR03435 family)